MIDRVANWLAIFILFLVPVGGIILFWLVHVLPERVAERRHHPQKDAIRTLCLLSLVFGGMLWPIAWLWAYSKPVLHQLAYGRDKHEDYYKDRVERSEPGHNGDAGHNGADRGADIDTLRQDVRRLEERLAATQRH
jgi:hypothetical protein